ncbi:MAG: alpha-amylase family glycosyl hydrolase [Chloroherpetonaceae bacterium]|nr:alpha-amylase family glycosyl hydrolase [Chloroherpetonaceae bacterium]
MFNPDIVIADPYSKAVSTRNNFRRYPARTLIADLRYDWEGDTWVTPVDHTSLIIYEAHVRDLTAHPSSGVVAKGTYAGLVEPNRRGGLSHLKALGINALELLPVQSFGTIELPYHDSSVTKLGYPVNTWNPYARNHWGYMTSYFFAPEAYYSRGCSVIPEAFNGMDANPVREFKDMVKALHREKIAVILDVVFNHVSQYDYNPFKYIDKFYYFRLDSEGNFLSMSGCGNDFKTERPMARKLILDCIRYWMTEYHIDGFRFDLAAMIDDETRHQIAIEARKINPNVILIAEPWGGGKYEPHRFSDIGWAAWNDQIRNGFKGQNPDNGLGFIFGKFQGQNTPLTLRNYVVGTLREFGGLFHKASHSVNYLESHDDYTLGDFIRLGLHEVGHDTRITDRAAHAKLSARALALNKFAALLLFTAQGITMIHEGQEYARSKVIAPTDAPDPNIGKIDHNSYEKDNETNYLNYDHIALNQELVNYYKGLIALRKAYPIFHSAPYYAVEFLDLADPLVLAFRLRHRIFADAMRQRNTEPYRSYAEQAKNDFIVVCNAHPNRVVEFSVPKGQWVMVANEKSITLENPHQAAGKLYIPPSSGIILMEKGTDGPSQ